MGDENQSEGRDRNGAIPTDQWQSKGVAGEKTRKSEGVNAEQPTTQPYGVDADEQVERTGRVEAVTGEARSFSEQGGKADEIPDAHDLTGPKGDPAEGKRPDESSWPA